MFWLRDGFTITDKFPGLGWFPAFEFSYRPALFEKEEEFRIQVSRAAGAKAVKDITVKFLLDHIVGWTLLDGDKEADIRATIPNLPRGVANFLVDCICSYGPQHQAKDEKNFA